MASLPVSGFTTSLIHQAYDTPVVPRKHFCMQIMSKEVMDFTAILRGYESLSIAYRCSCALLGGNGFTSIGNSTSSI